MIISLFLFRVKQIFRYVKAGGWRSWIAVPLVFLLVVYQLVVLAKGYPQLYQWLSYFALTVLLVGRTDITWLQKQRSKGLWYAFLENALLVLCLQLPFAFYNSSQIYLVLIQLLLNLLLTWILFKKPVSFKFRISPVSLTQYLFGQVYEINVVVRKYFVLILLWYVFNCVVSYFWPFSWFFIVIWAFVWNGAFSVHDPYEMIIGYKTQNNFFAKRLGSLFLQCNLFLVPIILLSLVHHHSVLDLAFLGVAVYYYNALLLYSFLLKYSLAGKPDIKLQFTIYSIVFSIIVLIIPLAIYLCYLQYKKAQTVLQLFLK